MLTILMPFLSKAWGYILAIGAIVAALGLAALKLFSAGKQAEQSADTAETLASVKEADSVQNDVAATPVAARRSELHDWSR